MTLEEIKAALNDGLEVFWKQDNYPIHVDSLGQYLICCTSNNYCIGLTWRDGKTLNGKESDFYIG